jgi:hypothetical protein
MFYDEDNDNLEGNHRKCRWCETKISIILDYETYLIGLCDEHFMQYDLSSEDDLKRIIYRDANESSIKKCLEKNVEIVHYSTPLRICPLCNESFLPPFRKGINKRYRDFSKCSVEICGKCFCEGLYIDKFYTQTLSKEEREKLVLKHKKFESDLKLKYQL